MFRIAARVLGPGADTEDITQEVFVRVFSRVSGLRDPTALGSFVFSVTVRILKWELRRSRVRRILQLSDTADLPEHPVEPADSEAREALGRLYAILDTLSADDRTAFVLRYMEGMSLPEIAEAVGVSLATVKRRRTPVWALRSSSCGGSTSPSRGTCSSQSRIPWCASSTTR
ncbi:RNA polymerase sigma factor [Sorangium sp. So ce296]|uniref:RNA polymerase sigma factor n=1 Tax=Sorangium sp. So ce296 TaxID=3133296 RepID=UPI003F5DC99C